MGIIITRIQSKGKYNVIADDLSRVGYDCYEFI